MVKDLKIPFFTILFIFLGLLLYVKIAGPIPFFINSVATTKTNLFQTEGTGKVTAVPDTALVNAGVTQTSATVSDTQDKTNKAAQKIIDEIKKLGIDEKNIKTTDYSVNPDYNYQSGQKIQGYTVSQNLEVKVSPIEKVNNVIDTATANGANIVGGANFIFSDQLQKKLENAARVEAVANAKDKAQSLANAAGIKLGRIVDVTESNSIYPRPVIMNSSMGGTATEKTQPTDITPGQNSVSISVTISYETY